MKNLQELKEALEQAENGIQQLSILSKGRGVVVALSCNDNPTELITALVTEMHRTKELATIINMATYAFHEGPQPDEEFFKEEPVN